MLDTLYTSDFYEAALFIAGFLTGLSYAFGGSGGLILIPFLIATGMPIHTALGTSKLSALAMHVTVFDKFRKTPYIMWNRLPIIIPLTIAGAVIGSVFTLSLDQSIIYPIGGVLLILIAPLALMKKDFGLVTSLPSSKRKIIGYAAFLGAMIFAGFFGAGAGIPTMFVLSGFWGLTLLQGHATMVIPFFILNLISSIVFAYHGHVDYLAAIILTISMALGGWIGAKFAVKGGNKAVKFTACAFAFAIGVKMIWDSIL